jgi:rubrerythrin
MLTVFIRRGFAVAGTLLLGVGVGWVSTTNGALAAMSNKDETIRNLQCAYDSEINTEARYLAFAAQADTEGYGAVASLFRATAKAEAIHAENHALALRGMGGEPVTNVRKAAVKSTRENLETARMGEVFDCEAMYTDFVTQAKKTGNTRVVRSLDLARLAEQSHLKLYQEALDNLQSWKGAKRAFYVCEVCGFTAGKAPDACSSCSAKEDMFITVR